MYPPYTNIRPCPLLYIRCVLLLLLLFSLCVPSFHSFVSIIMCFSFAFFQHVLLCVTLMFLHFLQVTFSFTFSTNVMCMCAQLPRQTHQTLRSFHSMQRKEKNMKRNLNTKARTSVNVYTEIWTRIVLCRIAVERCE